MEAEERKVMRNEPQSGRAGQVRKAVQSAALGMAAKILGCLMLCIALAAAGGMRVQAEWEEVTALEGTFGENGGLRWVMDEETKTITISGEDSNPGRTDTPPYYVTANGIFNQSVEYIKFDNCMISGSMRYLFCKLNSLKKIDFSNLNTRSVTDISSMFHGCSGLTSLDLSGLDTGSVTYMSWMFYGCSGLTSLDLSGLDTGNVTSMGKMLVFRKETRLFQRQPARYSKHLRHISAGQKGLEHENRTDLYPSGRLSYPQYRTAPAA